MAVKARRRDRLHNDLAAVRLLQRIAVISNEASSLSDAVQAALDEVCAHTGWPVGHAYFPDAVSPGELASTSLWHLDDGERFDTFREITAATPLRYGIGLPGQVLEARKPVWIEDVTNDSNFPRARTGRDIGVCGAFGFPVLAGKDVIVAILEFFSEDPEAADDELLELMEHVGTQLGRVSEREAAAMAMQDQVEYTKHLIGSAYDAFVAIDRTGLITGWNQAAEVMFGWPAEEVIGRPLADTIIPKQYRERHLGGVARYLATGAAVVLNKRIELSAVKANGCEFPIELAIWRVRKSGKTTFCAFIHDITERQEMVAGLKAADERSRNSEQSLIAAQGMAGVGSWEWDIERQTVTWSDQLYRNFGVIEGEFQPSFEGYVSLVHPDDRSRIVSSVTTALDSLGTFEFEHRSVDPSNGNERIHHCTGRVVVEGQRAIRMVGTNQDVTDRRRGEEAIREAYERERELVRKLRELDEAKTKFVSSVSHELRTPLTSIIGYLQMLQLTASNKIDPEHRAMVDVIDRNSHRLLSLIEDLLTQSRIESGTFKLALAPTLIAPIVSSAVLAMIPAAAEKDLGLHVTVDPDVGEVMADFEQLERLLLNLLTNAMKFTIEGSVDVDVRSEGDSVVLAVSDTGIGIPAEEIPKLFSPFFRSSTAGQTVPGTGLGLVIVKAIVDEHHGSIDIASKPGRGTTVTVKLPVAMPAARIA